MIVNKSIGEKYFAGWQRKNEDVTEIVLHGTGGGSTVSALLDWMLGGERALKYVKGIGLFHYLVGREGEVVEIIRPLRWVFHSSSGQHDKHTIGIELINPDHGRPPLEMNRAEYTDKQYEALFELIFDGLLPAFPNITSIVGHGMNEKMYSNGYRNCPGSFDWKRLGEELDKYGYVYKYKDQHYAGLEMKNET